MRGPSTSRLLGVAALVVATAVAAVLVLVPSARTAPLLGRAAGPEIPTGPSRLASASASGHARWVVEENARAGTTDWQVTGPVNRGNIEGFADATSAPQNTTVKLYVSTDADSFHVEAYRMGWYGGKQGRLVWKSPTMPGSRQSPAVTDPVTKMTEARWAPSLDVALDKNWPPGDYLLKLVGDNGFAQFVPLAVRDDTRKAALVVVNAVTTWQAYNRWGGRSLYEGVDRSGASSGDLRSQVVSFDRPYDNDSGAGDFLGNELPMVSLVEKGGYDVTYWTDVDLHARGDQLVNHKAVLTLGHDEYWSLEMRTHMERARDSGVNLAFFGANAIYRVIRLAPSPMGDNRHEINYRVAANDPMTGVDNSRVTVSWREPPVNRPESSLVGSYYQCNPVKADMVVADPSAWVFAGTGLAAGDRLRDVVGPEFDRYDVNAPQPPGPVQVLSHSPLRCRGESTHSDMTWYTVPSGAGVLATGTNWWISRLNMTCTPQESCLEERVMEITLNVLDAFAVGPAGLSHPSVANHGGLGDLGRTTTPLDAGERQGTPTTSSFTPTTGARPRATTTTTPDPTTTARRRPTTTTSPSPIPSLPFPRP